MNRVHDIVEHIRSNEDITLKYRRLGSLLGLLCISMLHLQKMRITNQNVAALHFCQTRKICQPIFWTLYKARRVPRSILGIEVM